MFCGNIFTSTDLQNHKKNHMKKLQKRFHRVNRALFLSLINAFELQKFIPKISQKIFWSAPCFPKIFCGGQCEALMSLKRNLKLPLECSNSSLNNRKEGLGSRAEERDEEGFGVTHHSPIVTHWMDSSRARQNGIHSDHRSQKVLIFDGKFYSSFTF